MAKDCFKDIERILPLGSLDLRSPDGALAAVDYRLIFNVTLNEQRSRCRRGGWKRLFSDSPYGFKNQDFHDQLVNCQFYYEEFVSELNFPGGLVGYQYSEFTPGYSIPGELFTTEYGPYCGYAPSVYGTFPTTPTFDQLFIADVFIGYPYFYIPDFGPCDSGAPYFWAGSYYSLDYAHQNPAVNVPSYQSGLFGVYSGPYDAGDIYCGTQQLLRPGCREAITLVGQITTESLTRKLVAATKSRIAQLNERTGNWRLIADGLGGPQDPDDNCVCSARRFSMATLGGFAFFTNNYDPVIGWRVDDPSTGCNLWGGFYIQDLLDLNILRAKVVVTWRGFLFVANVEENGMVRPFRIFWSDFNAPTSFIPGAESLAGFSDLGADENILAMATLGGGLRIYTDRAIYEVIQIGGEFTFAFRELYRGPRTLRYAYTLANGGDAHYYLSEDTICVLRESDSAPSFMEWMHNAGGAIFRGVNSSWLKSFTGDLSAFGPINKSHCDLAVGYYRKATDELFFSWPTSGNDCPNMTLGFDLRHGGADIIDHGFTAFGELIPDSKQTFIEWLVSEQICGWESFLPDLIKEGIPYGISSSFPNPPTSIINATEDPNLPSDPNSLCARLGTKTIEDLCKDCEVTSVFIMADADDKTLKEYSSDVFYRERYIAPDFLYDCPYTVYGSYVREGYVSLIQADLGDYGKRQEKMVTRLTVDFDAEIQTIPNDLKAQVSYAQNPDCALWSETVTQPLECVSAATDAEHAANKTRPDQPAIFNFYRRGRFVGWRLWIEGTGGGGCWSRLTQKARLAQGNW